MVQLIHRELLRHTRCASASRPRHTAGQARGALPLASCRMRWGRPARLTTRTIRMTLAISRAVAQSASPRHTRCSSRIPGSVAALSAARRLCRPRAAGATLPPRTVSTLYRDHVPIADNLRYPHRSRWQVIGRFLPRRCSCNSPKGTCRAAPGHTRARTARHQPLQHWRFFEQDWPGV